MFNESTSAPAALQCAALPAGAALRLALRCLRARFLWAPAEPAGAPSLPYIYIYVYIYICVFVFCNLVLISSTEELGSDTFIAAFRLKIWLEGSFTLGAKIQNQLVRRW